MRPFLVVAFLALFAVLMTSPAAGQSSRAADDELLMEILLARLEACEARIAAMTEQIASLEAEVKSLREGTTAGKEAGDSGAKVVQIVRVIPLEADGAKLAEARSLLLLAEKKDAEEAKLNKEREKLIDVKDYPLGWYDWSDERKAAWKRQSQEQKRRREELARQAVQIRADAKSLRARAQKLEKETNMLRQRIHAWDGERDIVLETERDSSAVLAKAAVVGFISWTGGTLISQDDFVQTWLVPGVRVAERPADFHMSP